MENHFNFLANQYDNWFYDNPHLFESELKAILSVMPIFTNCIEIGCGTGIFAEKLGIKTGIEPSKQMAEYAMKRNVHVLTGYAENIPANNSEFDCAVMITVDCFLSDMDKAFSEIYRILKINGSFVIAFLDKATPLGEIYEKNKRNSDFYRTAEFHTSDEIRCALEKAGFEVNTTAQTVYSLSNEPQSIKSGHGEGVFAVYCAIKR